MATTKLLNVRLAFPSLWHASKGENQEGDAKFSANLIMEPSSPAYKAAKAAIDSIAAAKWGPKAAAVLKAINKDKNALRPGDEHLDKSGEPYMGFEGNFYVVAKNKTRPTVLDQLKAPLTEQDGKPYGGCYVNAHVEFKCGDIPGAGKVVWAVLTGVQFLKDGEAFSGGRAASPEEFDEVAEDAPDYA